MVNRQATVLFVVLFFLLGHATGIHAYKVGTHENITSKTSSLSAKYNQFVSDSPVSLDASNNLMIWGSSAEDEIPRFLNHFYDPIDGSALSSVNATAIRWAYGSGEVGSLFENEYSWTNARRYMYEAFIETDEAVRREKYYRLYRSLGQIVHLVEDMAQPSHTRLDPHASHADFLGGFFAPLLNPSHLEDWSRINDNEIIAYANTASGPQAVTSFEQPFLTLASFSNRNFFSDDTIFQDYPQPAVDDTNYTDDFISRGTGEVAQVVAEDGEVYDVGYIVKTRGAYAGVKLAQVGYFGPRIFNFPGQNLAFLIDDEVAKENAEILIPLAVSYSAGLLDYFFRGQMVANGTPKQGVNNEINAISVKVSNATPGEEMKDGSLMVAFEYKPPSSTEIVYGVSDVVGANIVPGDSSQATYEFSFPEGIPVGSERIRYVLVFQGTLGSESGAVVASRIALCSGFCEDWESGSGGYYFVGGSSGTTTEGSRNFPTSNGAWDVYCVGSSGRSDTSAEAVITSDVSANQSKFLRMYSEITRSSSFGGGAGCNAEIVFPSPLSLLSHNNLSLDFYYDINIINLSPGYFRDWFIVKSANLRFRIEGADLGIERTIRTPEIIINGTGADSTRIIIYIYRSLGYNYEFKRTESGQWGSVRLDIKEILQDLAGVSDETLADLTITSMKLGGSIVGGRNSFFGGTYAFDNISLSGN